MINFVTILTVFLLLSSASSYGASMEKIPGTDVKADHRIVSAFTELDFQVKYDKNLKYSGTFSIKKHAIILRKRNKVWTLHEMGHFLSHLQGDAASTKKFKAIYKAEKRKYRSLPGKKDKKYVTKNCKEYFAQSFADYTIRTSALKKNRPDTYTYIKKQVETITGENIAAMRDAYGWAWLEDGK